MAILIMWLRVGIFLSMTLFISSLKIPNLLLLPSNETLNYHLLDNQRIKSSHLSLKLSSSAPHIFYSVATLLQQWPQTFFPNGHSIVPCTIPAFTNLYHGRTDALPPPSPEWLSFDIEMAYAIKGHGMAPHLTTYRATRPLKCIYLDGESGSLLNSARVGSQTALLAALGYAQLPGKDFDEDEYTRADQLCSLFRKYDLRMDGIVRMNAGFEIIICDFGSGALDVIGKVAVRRAEDISGMGERQFLERQGWGWFESATRQYKGETRVVPWTRGLISFYDHEFWGGEETNDKENLVWSDMSQWVIGEPKKLKDVGRRRRSHTVPQLSEPQRAVLLTYLIPILKDFAAKTEITEMNWTSHTRQILMMYAPVLSRLSEQLQHLLSSRQDETQARHWSRRLSEEADSFLVPYIEHPFNSSTNFLPNALTRCLIHNRLRSSTPLKYQERTLFNAANDVSTALCTVLVPLSLQIASVFPQDFDKTSTSPLFSTIENWRNEIEQLKAWLGWIPEWTTCSDRCTWNEHCYIPMWPLALSHPVSKTSEKLRTMSPSDGREWVSDEQLLWEPKCVSPDDKGLWSRCDPIGNFTLGCF